MMQRRVLGVLGGTHMSPKTVSKWAQEADVIIAADCGFHNVSSAGFHPHVAIGDFDSLSLDEARTASVNIHDLGQDDTDCSKLLRYAESQDFDSIVLICSEGDLMDHQIDAIHAAAKSSLEVRFALSRGIAYILRGPTQTTVPSQHGLRVSLLPITEVQGATLQGVEWEFDNRAMSPLGFTSISNKSTSETLTVEVKVGIAYLFVETDSTQWA